MFESLIVLPKTVSIIIIFCLVVAAIFELRHNYIGRVGIFLNSMLLWQIFYKSFDSLPTIMHWYLNIGTIIGIIALFAYLLRQKLPTIFYQFAFIAYGSLSLLIVIGFFVYWYLPNLFSSGQMATNASNIVNETLINAT